MEQWEKILRVPESKVNEIFGYIHLWKIGEVSRNGNGDVTVMSRRMIRDEKDRELNMLRQRRHRSNAPVTPSVTPLSQLSSSSSSSSSSKQKKIYKRKVLLPDEDWIKELQLKECYSHLNVNDQFQRCITYFETKGQGVSRRRFVVWLNDPRNKKPLQVKKESFKPQQTDQIPIWIKEAVKDGWKG